MQGYHNKNELKNKTRDVDKCIKNPEDAWITLRDICFLAIDTFFIENKLIFNTFSAALHFWQF